jgi:hypothetical protein
MDPYTYITNLEPDDLARLARVCETTPMYLEKLARAHRRGVYLFQPRLASLLETNSDGKVRRWESIPVGWEVTWPELVGSPGAPKPIKSKPRKLKAEA